MQISAQISRFHGTERPFEIREVPVIVTPEDTLVRVSLATICGSDLHTVSGRRDAPTPCVLGHEAVGTIAAPTQHRSVTGELLREGDRVTWSLMASCGTCAYCTDRHLPQKCDRLFKYGHARSEGATTLSGGFATHILLRPGTAIYHIPDALTDKAVVPINCALATVVNGLKTIGTYPNEAAVIHGAGMLGIYAACYLRKQAYDIVAVVDINEARLQTAKRFGATHTFNPAKLSVGEIDEALKALTNGRGTDLGVEVSGVTSGLPSLIAWSAVGGRCLTLGYVYPNAHISVDADHLVRKCVTLRGVHNYHYIALGDSLRFIEESRGHYPFDSLIGETYGLGDINAAFAAAKRRDALRIAIAPSL